MRRNEERNEERNERLSERLEDRLLEESNGRSIAPGYWREAAWGGLCDGPGDVSLGQMRS